MMSPFIAADLWAYDVEIKRWFSIKSESPKIPAPRWLHSAVVIGDRMIIFGGVSYSDIILGDIWVFNPDDNTWVHAVPNGDKILPREGHSATAMKGEHMVVFGGISYGHIPFNDLWIYDATRNEWTAAQPKGTPPPPRWLHTANSYVNSDGQEFLVVFGGVTKNWIPLNDLWVLDYAKLEWLHPKSVGLPPFPRMMHGAALVNDQLYIHAGIANNIPFDDVWVYDMTKGEWGEQLPHGAFPFAREGHSFTLVQPPSPAKQPDRRPEFNPPPTAPDQDNLTPLIKSTVTPRPVNRYRKEYYPNRWMFVFGGAGPKPKDTD